MYTRSGWFPLSNSRRHTEAHVLVNIDINHCGLDTFSLQWLAALGCYLSAQSAITGQRLQWASTLADEFY